MTPAGTGLWMGGSTRGRDLTSSCASTSTPARRPSSTRTRRWNSTQPAALSNRHRALDLRRRDRRPARVCDTWASVRRYGSSTSASERFWQHTNCSGRRCRRTVLGPERTALDRQFRARSGSRCHLSLRPHRGCEPPVVPSVSASRADRDGADGTGDHRGARRACVAVFLTLPLGVDPTALPLVLFVHGGPWYRDSWGFDSVVQMLANRGYAVLQVNFRVPPATGRLTPMPRGGIRGRDARRPGRRGGVGRTAGVRRS